VTDTTGDFYVVPTGAQWCSFVSITAALRAAERSTAARKTVHIAPGRYNVLNTGERFPLVVRGDITLVGAGVDATVIEGVGASSHREAGGALTDDQLTATLIVGSPHRRVELRDLTLRSGHKRPEFHSFGVLCDEGNARASGEQPPPNLVVERVRFGPGYDSGLAVTTTLVPAASGCNSRVSTSRFTENWNGIFALGCGAGLGEVPTALDLDPGADDTGSVFESSRYDEESGAGVLLWGCVARAHIRRAVFRNGSVGVQIDQRPPPSIFAAGYDIRIIDSEFGPLDVAGLRLWRAPQIAALTGNRFEGIVGAALHLEDHEGDGSPSLVGRNNVFRRNGVALSISGAHPLAASVDLGTDESPGHNVFSCNGLAVDGGRRRSAVEATVLTGGQLQLAGNEWDLSPPTVASRPGRSVDVLAPEGSAPNLAGARQASASCAPR
jgi:hypothetical protein